MILPKSSLLISNDDITSDKTLSKKILGQRYLLKYTRLLSAARTSTVEDCHRQGVTKPLAVVADRDGVLQNRTAGAVRDMIVVHVETTQRLLR